MPTNLGVLPASKPFPNGKIQIKRGVADVSRNYAAANNGTTIVDSNGAPFQLQYTPVYPCYWLIKVNVMANGLNDGIGWRRWDHAINITPADADGNTAGVQAPCQVYDYTTVQWRTFASSVIFKLNAGITYTAYLTTASVGAGTVTVHVGPQWCRIVGRVIGESFF